VYDESDEARPMREAASQTAVARGASESDQQTAKASDKPVAYRIQQTQYNNERSSNQTGFQVVQQKCESKDRRPGDPGSGPGGTAWTGVRTARRWPKVRYRRSEEKNFIESTLETDTA